MRVVPSSRTGDVCSICLDEFDPAHPPVTHEGTDGAQHQPFHEGCFLGEFQQRGMCPFCKQRIDPSLFFSWTLVNPVKRFIANACIAAVTSTVAAVGAVAAASLLGVRVDPKMVVLLGGEAAGIAIPLGLKTERGRNIATLSTALLGLGLALDIQETHRIVLGTAIIATSVGLGLRTVSWMKDALKDPSSIGLGVGIGAGAVLFARNVPGAICILALVSSATAGVFSIFNANFDA